MKRDATTAARLGKVTTPHGEYDTPAFMPVGTQGTIKGLLPDRVAGTGSRIILANTYHLMLRPGSALVRAMGGLHRWMRWDGPILTDSGGFQVFSLADLNRIDDDGVIFKSHLDGATITLTPERSMQVQNELGADIIMAFDDCPPAQAPQVPAGLPPEYTQRIRLANERTIRWLSRCVTAHARKEDQALFGIVQGGTDLAQRSWCAEQAAQFDLPGYAIGGVAVGEGHDEIVAVVNHTAKLLPEDRPRYLMGVGYERDILAAVRAGVDMFDCVLPTRNGRTANAFTPTGQIRLRNAKYARDDAVIDAGCDCAACGGGFTRSYLRHLFMADEMLGPILLSLHNIRHFQRFMLDIRRAIQHNDWSLVTRAWPAALAGPAPESSSE
jgi:queuine tRNA-ribosyltransferase